MRFESSQPLGAVAHRSSKGHSDGPRSGRDDELAIAKLLEDVLTDAGHRVLIAGNGRRALEIGNHEQPAIVLTDFMMPVMDGVSFVRAMAADEKLKSVSVIMMSSMPEPTVADRCDGYVSFVRKPFKILDIVNLVSDHLASK